MRVWAGVCQCIYQLLLKCTLRTHTHILTYTRHTHTHHIACVLRERCVLFDIKIAFCGVEKVVLLSFIYLALASQRAREGLIIKMEARC